MSVIFLAGAVWFALSASSGSAPPNVKDLEGITALIQNGHQAEAIPQLERWLRPDNDEETRYRLHSLMGVALHRENRYPEAAGHFMKAAAIDANGYPLHLNLNETFRAMGMNALSTASLRTALELAPDNMLVNIKWRIRLIETGNANLVENELKQLFEAGKNTPDVMIASAALELRKGNTEASTRLIRLAKSKMSPELFQAIMSDPIFTPLYPGDSAKKE